MKRYWPVYVSLVLCGIAFACLALALTTIPTTNTTLEPQPQFDYTNTYGPPANLTVTCTFTGGPGHINPDAQPKPGQRLVRDCTISKTAPNIPQVG